MLTEGNAGHGLRSRTTPGRGFRIGSKLTGGKSIGVSNATGQVALVSGRTAVIQRPQPLDHAEKAFYYSYPGSRVRVCSPSMWGPHDLLDPEVCSIMKMKRESMSVAIAETSIYQQRIDELRRIKVEYTNAKIEGLGRTMGIDDYGSVPWPEPIPFEVMPTHPSGGCYGATAIANNFRAWLEAHPVIIHPTSSLCGGWVSTAPGIGGWACPTGRGSTTSRSPS